MTKNASRTGAAIAACVLLTLGYSLRLGPAPSIFHGDHVDLAPSDSYYYLRFALALRASFPFAPTRDFGLAAPVGLDVPCPPGHGLIVAAFMGTPSDVDVERRLSSLVFMNVWISLVGAAVLALWASRRWGPVPALVALAPMTMAPAAYFAGAVGDADHHAHEPWVVAAAGLFFFAAQTSRDSVRSAIACGLVAGIGHLFTTTAFLVLPALLPGVAALAVTRSAGASRALDTAWVAAVSAMIPVALGAGWAGRLWRIDYYGLSGFHVWALGAFASAAYLFSLMVRARIVARLGWFVASATGVASPWVISELWRAAQHMARKSALIADSQESVPLFSDGLAASLPWLGGTLFATPVLLGLLWVTSNRRRRATVWMAASSLFAFGALALLQGRFLRPAVGAVAAAAVVAAFQSRHVGPRLARHVAVACLGLLLALPADVPGPREDPWNGFVPAIEPLIETLRALPREGAVLAPWNMGYFIAALSGHAVIASPMGQLAEAEDAAEWSHAAFSELDEAGLLKRCDERGVGYVLAMAEPAGRQRADSFSEKLRRDPKASTHFHLVTTSAAMRDGVPLYRLFSVVP